MLHAGLWTSTVRNQRHICFSKAIRCITVAQARRGDGALIERPSSRSAGPLRGTRPRRRALSPAAAVELLRGRARDHLDHCVPMRDRQPQHGEGEPFPTCLLWPTCRAELLPTRSVLFAFPPLRSGSSPGWESLGGDLGTWCSPTVPWAAASADLHHLIQDPGSQRMDSVALQRDDSMGCCNIPRS